MFDAQVRKRVREELDINDKALTVCHVGRFDKVKNHSFIVDIFAEILKKRPDAQLLLIGDGVLRAQTEQKVHEKGLDTQVKFLGVRRDVHELLQAFDVMLFPSLFEGLPVTLVEAQSAGLPCVISENIPNEVIITDLVEQMSLAEPAARWAERVTAAGSKGHDKTIYPQIVTEAGFDIKKNAQWLQDFYLNSIASK